MGTKQYRIDMLYENEIILHDMYRCVADIIFIIAAKKIHTDIWTCTPNTRGTWILIW